ncbi:MAG TPA: PQQ-binding-like beta-propeller repeat protein [Vicinamibacterales bacterium]|nr:PQQ-binding-like beta-propeller repeat protein [Vicinamibacterales bacterium]
MMVLRRACFVAFVCAALSLSIEAQRPAADWPQWRGPNRDGAAPLAAPAAWPEQLSQKWRVTVGDGYATPLVVGNRVYQFSRQGDNEVMTAFDADTGKEVWKNPGYPAIFEMQSATKQHGPGPKSTPVFSNGRLYTIGMTGVVTAWDAASGKQVWQHPGDVKNMPMFTSHAFSPLVDRGLVIFHLGGNAGGALTAFDINTGAVKWSWKGDGPGYGSPVIADIGGTRQIITITQKTLVSVDAATGAVLWERPWVSPNQTNSITPVVYGQTVIVSGNGDPTTEFSVTKKGTQWVVEQAWQNADIPMRMTNPVLIGDTLFGMSTRNSGQYFAVDAKSGKTLWTSEGRQAGNAALASAPSLLLSLEDDGELVVAKASQTAFELVKKYKLADSATWTQAAYSGNRIYVKDVTNLTLWTLN